MGIYQLKFLGRGPAWAAVNESVELVKQTRKKSAAAFVNAALRCVASAKNGPADLHFLVEASPAEMFAIAHSHPTWLVER